MISDIASPGSYSATEGVRRRVAGRDQKLVRKVWSLWRPPLQMTVSEWAERYRVLSRGATAEPGKYNADRLPWQRFIQDAVNDPRYTSHVICGASQTTGKTEILNNIVGFFVHADPSSIMVAYPTKESAASWSKDKFGPMVEDTPVLKKLIRDPRARDSGNTIAHKKFPGGSLTVVGKNSPSGLRQRSVRITIEDEVDSDKGLAGVEGDASALLKKRSESFSRSIHIEASTPTISGQSRIWRDLEASEFFVWDCPCKSCGAFQDLKWAQVRWDSDRDEGGKILAHHPHTARYVCEKCGGPWSDLDRQRAIMRGRPRAKNPFNRIFGFHQNGLYKLLGGKPQYSGMLEEFVVNFLEAQRGGPEKLKVWTNTFLCECWEETFEKLDEKEVLKRAEDYNPDEMLPADVLRIEGAADVQEDRIEAELIGYGQDEETWGLGYVIFHGDTSRDQVWDELDKFIAKTFRHPCGKMLACTSFFIDSGAKQDRVFQFTAPRKSRGVYASKGYNSPGKQIPILPRRPSINNKRKVPQWIVGVTAAKTVLYDRIMLPVPGPRSMHFPKGHGYDARYFRQLTSERRKTRYSHGKPYYIFEAGDRRNEPLDIRVYALAAHRRVLFDAVALRKELGADVQAKVTPAQLTGERVPSALPRAGNLLLEHAPLPTAPIAATGAAEAAAKPNAGAIRLPAYVPMHLRKPKPV